MLGHNGISINRRVVLADVSRKLERKLNALRAQRQAEVPAGWITRQDIDDIHDALSRLRNLVSGSPSFDRMAIPALKAMEKARSHLIRFRESLPAAPESSKEET